jgi:hypothetical protein
MIRERPMTMAEIEDVFKRLDLDSDEKRAAMRDPRTTAEDNELPSQLVVTLSDNTTSPKHTDA